MEQETIASMQLRSQISVQPPVVDMRGNIGSEERVICLLRIFAALLF